MTKAALLVDPDLQGAGLLAVQQPLREIAALERCADFRGARTRILSAPPDLIVTNLRLGAYNGLHLVLLARRPSRCLVYATEDDPVLMRQVQAAGVFYERLPRLPVVISSYLNTTFARS